jgi:hypothetical protein
MLASSGLMTPTGAQQAANLKKIRRFSFVADTSDDAISMRAGH